MVARIKKAVSTTENKDEKLLHRIRERFDSMAEEAKENRVRALEDLRFCDIDSQWDDAAKAIREKAGQPCLTSDKLSQYIKQITNESRQNRPAIQIAPSGDGADKEVANVIEGMVRHINDNTDGDIAIDTSFDNMVRCGQGYIRVNTDYENDKTFNQIIQIVRVPNPFSVYFDPACVKVDYSDARDCIVFEDLDRDTFKELYPDAKLCTGQTDWTSVGTQYPEWVTEDGVRVVEYFYKENVSETLFKLSDGSIVKELPEKMPKGITVKDKREVLTPTIKWVKAVANEKLDEGEWMGKYFPIVPVLGEELNIDGKRIYSGLVRRLKDSQHFANYMLSSLAQAVSDAPMAPYIGAAGFMGNNPEQWKNMRQNKPAAIEYAMTVDPTTGVAAPPPARNLAEVPIQAILAAHQMATNDLNQASGIYQANLGNAKSDQSGIAIQSLQHQGQTGNFNYQDNLSRAIKHLGRIIVDLIPKVYDSERVVRIINPDKTQTQVTINGAHFDEGSAVAKLYDVTTGTYDVTVETGPSYQTKRDAELAMMVNLLHEVPSIGTVAPDLLVSLINSPISSELVDRLKMALPPQIQQAITTQKGNQANQVPPALQQKIQELIQAAQQKDQLIGELSKKLDNKIDENRTKVEVANIQAQNNLQIALLQTKANEALKGTELELKHLRERLAQESAQDDKETAQANGSSQAGPSQPQMGQGSPLSAPQANQAPPAAQNQAQAPDDLSGNVA